jgi:hypothetical protein
MQKVEGSSPFSRFRDFPGTGDFLPLRRGASARRGGVLGDFDHVLRSPLGVGFVAETKTLRYRRAHFPAR